MFSKKPDPGARPKAERFAAMRKAVFAAMESNAVLGLDAASALQGIAQELRSAHACTAPLASATPRYVRLNKRGDAGKNA